MKIKKILALVLILTLLCGMQIVADDIDTTRAACTHVDTTFFSVESSYSNLAEDVHHKFVRILYHCIKCGKVWEETNSANEPHHFIDNPDDPDFKWCTICDGVYKK